MTDVVHLSTVHLPFDTRIFHKEAKSLVQAGYDVSLVAHHETDETVDGVQIRSLGTSNNRVDRWQSIPKAYRIAKEANADIYHFHDPELLPVGVALSERTPGKVIYDVHEYFEGKIRKRQWIPDAFKPLLVWTYPRVQRFLIRRFDAVVTATEMIAEPLEGDGVEHVVPVRNFPATDKIEISADVPIERTHENVLVYVGGLRENRGLFRMIHLLKELRDRGLDVGLWLIGPFQSESDERRFHEEVTQADLQEHVRTFGWMKHLNVFDYLASADVGLAILDPDETERAISTKIFEYMYVNIPVVASGTQATERYVPSDCGSVVSYDDTSEQVEVVAEFLDAGETKGKEYVEEKYNWNVEKERLLDLYDSLT